MSLGSSEHPLNRLFCAQAPTSTRTIRLDVRQSAATADIFYAVGATIANDGTVTRVSVFKKVDDGAGNYTICELAEGAFFADLWVFPA